MANDLMQRENGTRTVAVARERRGIDLQTLDEMLRFGECVVKAGMAMPNETPETAMLKVQYGLELGLSPMQAIQNVMVVNNRPAVWGDAMLAICMASPLFDHAAFEEKWINESNTMTAVCTVRRLPDGKPITRKWSQSMTEDAGLMGKETHKKYPARMRQMRARSWALRDAFPDLLKGILSVEEARDIGGVIDVEIETAAEPAKPKSGLNTPGGTRRRKVVQPAAPVETAEPKADAATEGDEKSNPPENDMAEGCFQKFYARATDAGMEETELRALIDALECDVDEIEMAIAKREKEAGVK